MKPCSFPPCNNLSALTGRAEFSPLPLSVGNYPHSARRLKCLRVLAANLSIPPSSVWVDVRRGTVLQNAACTYTARSSSTQMVCRYKAAAMWTTATSRPAAPSAPCHLWSERLHQRLGILVLSVRGSGAFFICICVFCPTVYQLQQEAPRPKRITCPQEVGTSVNLWAADMVLLLFWWGFYDPVDPCHRGSSWYFEWLIHFLLIV